MSQIRQKILARGGTIANPAAAPTVDDLADLAPESPEAEAIRVERAHLAPTVPLPPPPARDRLDPLIHAEVHRKVVRELGPLLFDDSVHDGELEMRLREVITEAFHEADLPPHGPLYEQF